MNYIPVTRLKCSQCGEILKVALHEIQTAKEAVQIHICPLYYDSRKRKFIIK